MIIWIEYEFILLCYILPLTYYTIKFLTTGTARLKLANWASTITTKAQGINQNCTNENENTAQGKILSSNSNS